MEAGSVFDGLVSELASELPRHLVRSQDPVGWLFLDSAAAVADALQDPIQAQAVDSMGGTVASILGSAVAAWFANPAAAIGAWLTLSAWSGPEAHGGLAFGYSHRADLLRLVTAEAAALANSAEEGELWVSFELTNVVDLEDPRFRVEKTDRGALIPSSCKLTLREGSGAGA